MGSLNERMRTPEEVQAGANPTSSVSGGILSLKIERATTVALAMDDSQIFPDGQCQALEHCVHGHWFGEGEQYVTFGGGHMHVDCLQSMANKVSRLDFLLMLAAHVACAPSRHNAGTVRQVINGLVRALGATQREAEKSVADAYARGARETAKAIADVGGFLYDADLPIDIDSGEGT